MKNYLSSLFFIIIILVSLSGGSKPKSKFDEIRERAEGLPESTQKLVEEYIQLKVVFDMKVNYRKQMAGEQVK